MRKVPCRYTGAVLDTSGYANACRNYIGALIDSKEVDLTVGVATFEQQKTTHGSLQHKIKPYIGRTDVDYKIHIIHLTPENFPVVRESNKYNIGYTVWETDKLPDNWVHLCNIMDEIWVPSKWNVEIFKKSGVSKPVYCIPHGIPIPDMSDAKHVTMAPSSDTFVFYSIFQWIERKNPIGLLKAYLTEFKKDEDVVLCLKSYRINTSGQEQNAIKADIARLKQSLRLHDYPELRFFGTLMSAEHMKGFHQRGDCFVLPHRGEGFGIPHAEAMSFGKPVIATGWSGNTEFMNDENSYLLKYQLTPCSGMIFPNYHGHMTWAEPDIMDLRKKMRFVFENREAARRTGEIAKQYIANQLNWERIGKLMVDRIKEIHEKLTNK